MNCALTESNHCMRADLRMPSDKHSNRGRTSAQFFEARQHVVMPRLHPRGPVRGPGSAHFLSVGTTIEQILRWLDLEVARCPSRYRDGPISRRMPALLLLEARALPCL